MAKTIAKTAKIEQDRPFWQGGGWTALVVALILESGLLAYCNSFGAPFILDDPDQIISNPGIRQFWPPWKPMTFGGQMTRPVVYLTLAANYAISEKLDKGPDPHNHPPGLHEWNYHVFNILIHLLAGMVLYGLVKRTLWMPRLGGRFERHAPLLAAVIAMIWLVHPMLSSAVTYVIQRAESLMGLMYLLTMYCGVRAGQSPRPIRWIVLAGVACAAGMGTKQVMVTAPLMLIAYDWAFQELDASQRRRLLLYFVLVGLTAGLAIANGPVSKMLAAAMARGAEGTRGEALAKAVVPWILYLLAAVPVATMASDLFSRKFPVEFRRRIGLYTAACLGYAVLALTLTVTPMDNTAGFLMAKLTWWQYGLTQFFVHVKYLALSIVPYPLCLDYEIKTVASFADVWFYALIVLGLMGLTVWGLIKRPVLGFLGLWYFLILIPSSSVMPIKDKIFEFRVYVSLAALIALGVMAAYVWGGRFLARLPEALGFGRWRRQLLPILGVPLAAVLLAVLPPTGVGEDPYDLPKPPFNIYATTSQPASTTASSALPDTSAPRLYPWNSWPIPVPAPNVVGAQWSRVPACLAVAAVLIALAMIPGLRASPGARKIEALLLHWSAMITALVGMLAIAMAGSALRALDVLPERLALDFMSFHLDGWLFRLGAMLLAGAVCYPLGRLFWRREEDGSPPDVRRFAVSGGLGLGLAAVLGLTAMTILRNVDYRSEESIWGQTLALRPHNQRAHSNMGVVLLQSGKPTSLGLRQLQLSVICDPYFLDAIYNLGVMAGKEGHPADALVYYRDVLRKDPQYVGARCNLAAALQDVGRADEAIAEYRVILAQVDNHVLSLINLGGLLTGNGSYSEAEKLLQKAIEIEPRDPRPYPSLLECYRGLGKTKEAAEIEKVIQRFNQPAAPRVNQPPSGYR